MAHESVRPSFEGDVVVRLRLTPAGLEALREGVEVSHMRLDACSDLDVFDLYTESAEDLSDRGGIPAWEAPHSVRFRAAVDNP